MSQVFPIIALSDPTKLASLTHEQRLHVSTALARIGDEMQALLVQVDTWLAEAHPRPEPTDEVVKIRRGDQVAVVPRTCFWCHEPMIGVVDYTVLGITLGLRPACLTHMDPKER
jgi:hypothetical protein